MTEFLIGTRAFRSKDAAKLEIRRVLHTSPIDQPLSGDDLELITALYEMHPRREDGTVIFCVGINDYHGAKTRGFQGITTDGAKIAWSYYPCLMPGSDRPDLLRAMRAAIILSQRDALRAAYRGRALIPCHTCKSGVQLASAQVHHMPPKFRDIADAFVGLIGGPSVITAPLGDDFEDIGIKRRWVMFHDAIAQRVVVCAKCNAADERHAAEG